jgi:hypothetical protein
MRQYAATDSADERSPDLDDLRLPRDRSALGSSAGDEALVAANVPWIGRGQDRVRVRVSFQDDAWVWLGTTTDAERDALAGTEPTLLSKVRRTAERHGFAPEKVCGISVESEETVARDYEGSWFYALR